MFYAIQPTEPERWTNYALFRPGQEPEAFTPKECDRLLALADALPADDGKVMGNVAAPKIRNVEVRSVLFDSDTTWAFDKLISAARGANAHWWNYDLTHLLNIEVLRYGPKQHYVSHIDLGPGSLTRKISLVVMLSDPDDYEGGDLELRFADKAAKAPRERGTIVVFPSWMLHRVTPVKSGIRRTATAWVQGPVFR